MNSNLSDLLLQHSKRKRAQQKCEVELQGFEQEQKNLSLEAAHLYHQITAICIQERSKHVQYRMAEDYNVGMGEFEVEYPDQDTASILLQKGVKIYCVCPKAFQKQQGRFPYENMPPGFDKVEDTYIPDLTTHCTEFTLNAREDLADISQSKITRLEIRMRNWADNTTPDKQITTRQERLLKEKFEALFRLLRKVCC
jgi:hypothetical protein